MLFAPAGNLSRCVDTDVVTEHTVSLQSSPLLRCGSGADAWCERTMGSGLEECAEAGGGQLVPQNSFLAGNECCLWHCGTAWEVRRLPEGSSRQGLLWNDDAQQLYLPAMPEPARAVPL